MTSKRFLQGFKRVWQAIASYWFILSLCAWSIVVTLFITMLLSTSTLPSGVRWAGSFVLLGVIVGPSVIAYQVMLEKHRQQLDQMQQQLVQMQQQLDQVDGDYRQLRYGDGLTDREHKVLLSRLAGITIETMTTTIGASKPTIDREIRNLKDKGILQDNLQNME